MTTQWWMLVGLVLSLFALGLYFLHKRDKLEK
jgi:LPXTG-motif cell wall-anchored protein